MIMMRYSFGMVDWQKAFSLIFSWGYCQRSSPSWNSDMPQAGFEAAQNLSSGLVESRMLDTLAVCHTMFIFAVSFG